MKLDNYDRHYSPAAPIVVMRLIATNSNLNEEVPALIDPGADQTLIPEAVLRRLNLAVPGSATIVSAAGAFQSLEFAAIIEIDGLPPVALNVAEFDFKKHAVLGRDYLNQFKVTLDGPNFLFSIE